jgi:hypothetical protein
MVRDSSGCRRVASAELHNPDTIVIASINVTPADSVNPGNITIIALSGNEALTYSINGINFLPTATFSVPANGSYTIYMKNSSGCIVQQNVIVSGIDDFSMDDFELSVYPNPANDELTVFSPQFSEGKIAVTIYDVAGRRIYEVSPTTINHQLQTTNFANGPYLLRVGNAIRRFVVMH